MRDRGPSRDRSVDRLLLAALAGDPFSWRALFQRLAPKVLAVSRRRARDLASDLHEEVLQQTFLVLLGKQPSDFDPNRGTALQFVTGLVMNAVRVIRSVYRAPGQRSRPSGKGGRSNVTRVLSLDRDLRELESSLVVIAMTRDQYEREVTTLEEAIDFDILVLAAPVHVAVAMMLVVEFGCRLESVARALRMSPTALRQDVRQYLDGRLSIAA